MRAYKIEIYVLDLDEIGEHGIKDVIENTRYPNRCITPEVKSVESRDIGEWCDEHPLNSHSTADEEYKRLFAKAEGGEGER
jgi:hypothetical protein